MYGWRDECNGKNNRAAYMYISGAGSQGMQCWLTNTWSAGWWWQKVFAWSSLCIGLFLPTCCINSLDLQSTPWGLHYCRHCFTRRKLRCMTLINVLPTTWNCKWKCWIQAQVPEDQRTGSLPTTRGVPSFGFSWPHWRKKTCFGPHIKYTNTNNSWWAKKILQKISFCFIIMFSENL